MLTRCPACQTMFRVSAEQLAARHGRVRCGHCLNAFNARHNAVEGAAPDEDEGPAEEAFPRQETPDPVEPAPVADAAPTDSGLTLEWVAPDDDGLLDAESPVAAAETVTDDASAHDDPEPTAANTDPAMPAVLHTRSNPIGTARLLDEWEAAEPRADTTDPQVTEEPPPQSASANPTEETTEPAAPAILARSSPEDEQRGPIAATIPVGAPRLGTRTEPAEARPRNWGILVGCLTMSLLVQGVFLLRQPLTKAIPGLRPPLLALCERLGCDLSLPRDAAEISIETSDLHPEPGGPGQFVLNATLRNRASFPQAFPHVELSLTDAADKPLVRRVFSPEEWSSGAPISQPFAPNGVAAVVLPFSAPGVAAVGYRVYAFYP